MRITFRIYTHRGNTQDSHSYIMGTDSGGLTERMPELIEFDPEITTFEDLRVKIEVCFDRGMNRRTSLYQEILQAVQNSHNPHG